MMNVLALYQLKGGVGKTSTAVNLASLAAASGLQVLLWDLDPQGAATWLSGVDATLDAKSKHWLKGKSALGRYVERSPVGGFDVLPAASAHRLLDVLLNKVDHPEQALAKLLKPFSEHYQLVILDAPPSLSHLADNVMIAADCVLLPVIPGFLAQRTLELVAERMDVLKQPRRKMAAFYTMVDRRRTVHREQRQVQPVTGVSWLDTDIPYASSVERMGLYRQPLSGFTAASDPANAAYAALWLAVQQQLSRLRTA